MLPYKDTKPVGAADFYFAINATFRFIRSKLGDAALVRYWTDLGTRYFAPVTDAWRAGGLSAVAAYWRDFFAAEPGGTTAVTHTNDQVVVEVRQCPAIHHLRAHGRAIEPWFCRHCYHVSAAMARPAGLEVRVSGGNGTCRQVFSTKAAAHPAQNLKDITSCA